jgi:hypothetical protein
MPELLLELTLLVVLANRLPRRQNYPILLAGLSLISLVLSETCLLYLLALLRAPFLLFRP